MIAPINSQIFLYSNENCFINRIFKLFWNQTKFDSRFLMILSQSDMHFYFYCIYSSSFVSCVSMKGRVRYFDESLLDARVVASLYLRWGCHVCSFPIRMSEQNRDLHVNYVKVCCFEMTFSGNFRSRIKDFESKGYQMKVQKISCTYLIPHFPK